MPPISTARLTSETVQQLAADPVTDIVPVIDQITMRDIVDSSVAGSTNDATFRFLAANDVVTGTGMAAVHSATLGDSVLISKRGIYKVEFTFSAAVSDEVRLGISKDVAAGGLTTDPDMTTAGMLDVGGGLLPAATTAYWKLSAEITVNEVEAAAGVTVRAHGTDAADGVVADAAIAQNTDCFMRVTRTSELAA